MPTLKTRKRSRRVTGGRPSLFQGAKARTFNLTDDAIAKARADAETMGRSVSQSQAIEAAIRAYKAEPVAGA